MLVGDRTHDGTNSQAVEVVIDEDQHAQDGGGDHSAGAGLDVLGSPAAVSSGTASLVDQADHHAQNHQEQQDAHVPGVGQLDDHHVEGVGDHAPGVEVGVQQSAGQDTDEQGGIDLLGDQSQTDGDDGGQQSPDGGIGADGFPHHGDSGGDVLSEAGIGAHIVSVAVQIFQSGVGIGNVSGTDAEGEAADQSSHHQQQHQSSCDVSHVFSSFLFLKKKP